MAEPTLVVCSEAPPQTGGIGSLLETFLHAAKAVDGAGPLHLLARAGTTSDLTNRVFGRLSWPSKGLAHAAAQGLNATLIAGLHKRYHYGHIIYFDAAARAHGVARPSDVPTTIYVHGSEMLVRPGEAFSRRLSLQVAALRSADRVFANSRATAQLIERAAPGVPSEVLYPSFDPRRIYEASRHQVDPFSREPRRLRLLTVSRLAERKGHARVLDVLAGARQQLPPFEYIIVGGGPLEEQLKAQCRKLGLQDVVRFVGRVPTESLGAYYGHADIFIMLSQQATEGVEGFGLTYIEAGLSGCAVIGSRHEGAEEAVQHGVTGLTVDARNADAVVDALRGLALSPQERARLASSARERALQSLTPERFAHTLLQL